MMIYSRDVQRQFCSRTRGLKSGLNLQIEANFSILVLRFTPVGEYRKTIYILLFHSLTGSHFNILRFFIV